MANRPSQGTTQPGFINRNAQRVIRATGLPGTDNLQTAYVLECEQCQHRYAANGSDIFERRCPKCQTAKPGIPIAADELLKD
jgi:PHP family Zn ribbon phosphoesterase